jgi:hypothetical protein
MPQLKIQDAVYELTIDYQVALNLATPLMLGIIQNLRLLTQGGAVRRIHYRHVGPLPMDYRYTMTGVDGRAWVLNIEYVDGLTAEPMIRFNTDSWFPHEYLPNLPIREACVTLTREFGSTLFDCKWN